MFGKHLNSQFIGGDMVHLTTHEGDITAIAHDIQDKSGHVRVVYSWEDPKTCDQENVVAYWRLDRVRKKASL